MAITAAMVKELRERTGLGMMDCKKALEETGGDLEQAIEELRKKSALKAAKKAGRTTADGLLHNSIQAVFAKVEDFRRAGTGCHSLIARLRRQGG